MTIKAIAAFIMILNSAIVLGQYAEFSFDQRIHKFEEVNEGAQLEHTFTFENKGKVPLVISKYEVECDCTKAIYPKAPIMPGEQGEITITFDTKGKLGWQYRKIQLYANTKKTPYWIEVRVKVNN
ncbi:MAG TPA: DUF1573 domain-containing protein [Flavobacteriales bacterium]|nr:DUF1573 domain-containing protein [Flavobacteriales bacterium]|tara:strand:+ start:4471 stop:4845 length:375 start_codon:yes stop_codon:yes gene_type:complete